jgi:hypothetical protein
MNYAWRVLQETLVEDHSAIVVCADHAIAIDLKPPYTELFHGFKQAENKYLPKPEHVCGLLNKQRC